MVLDLYKIIKVYKTTLRVSFTIPNLSSQIPVGGFPVSLFSSNWAISSPFRKKYINRNYFTVLTLFSKRKLLPHSNFFCKKVRHKCWVTLMAFASINPTNPRTKLWNFHKFFSRIGDFEKRPFWKIGHFEFFSSIFYFFCFIPMKISTNLYGRMDGSNIWRLPSSVI